MSAHWLEASIVEETLDTHEHAASPATVGLLDRIAGAAIAIAGLALVGMVAVQALQVFARYVLNDSPGWTEPVALILLNTAMSFGAAAGVHHGAHFGFFVLVHAAPPPIQRVLLALSNSAIALIGAALAWWGGELLLDGIDIPMAGAPLPQSAVYAPMAIGGALMAVFALQRLFAVLAPATSTMRSE
ncbi:MULTISPECIES: TRAP transporter small permease [unclassified Lysobacter]|uniref:TRAP transporter small permease n=1 Tax=unclassified Lysobacter TaxID=2635362 RepID=UPI001BEB73FC|nr:MULTISPECIES: TRAP transporter small permease [unclassified Lysobacter]MBT2749403.1 TRAP transporter small permease [Lysobacter sp. ISL-42]MBT2753673.1 TRAP transporter small permease [Lysobacter sp. ISL-50]MBT2779271.1 TRAP transporter small permease [Lysobacter sp. ISL-54]MBT2781943.1 TRAP transporter small permease [Lysobacter sp. ISL-52]